MFQQPATSMHAAELGIAVPRPPSHFGPSTIPCELPLSLETFPRFNPESFNHDFWDLMTDIIVDPNIVMTTHERRRRKNDDLKQPERTQ